MSRAEPGLPPTPRLGRALREAAIDLYYNSIRLVGANVIWGAGVLTCLFLITRSPVFAPTTLALVPLTASLLGLATTLHREGRAYWSDAWDSLRGSVRRVMAVGAVQLVLAWVAIIDIGIGLTVGGVLGSIILMTGVYTLLALWIVAVATWPLILDPLRRAEGLRSILRTGVILVVAHPIRMAGLALVTGVFLVLSLVLTAAIITVSGAYVMLVLARYVLPAADRLEGRASMRNSD